MLLHLATSRLNCGVTEARDREPSIRFAGAWLPTSVCCMILPVLCTVRIPLYPSMAPIALARRDRAALTSQRSTLTDLPYVLLNAHRTALNTRSTHLSSRSHGTHDGLILAVALFAGGTTRFDASPANCSSTRHKGGKMAYGDRDIS